MPDLRVRVLDARLGVRVAFLSPEEARVRDLRDGERVLLAHRSGVASARLVVSGELAGEGEVVVPRDMAEGAGLAEGDAVSVRTAPMPRSLRHILKKLGGQPLSSEEIREVVSDIASMRLTRVEVAAFALANHVWGTTMEEIEALTKAFLESGERIDFGRSVYEKHSIGGVPGNKVSLIIVPVAAAAGITIPKTSTRAITSPSGTADTMEVLAPVDLTVSEFKDVVSKAGGCIVSTERMRLAPTDDAVNSVTRDLLIDPEGLMIAGIMAKKLAVGCRNLVLDIPTGSEAKVESLEEAESLAAKFVEVGRRFGVRVNVGITYGGQPVGHAVGPALEAREALEALMGGGPGSLVEKSSCLAGMLLEMAGLAARGRGTEAARELISSGRALEKMREIVEAQGGDARLDPSDVPVGQYVAQLRSPASGYVTKVSNAAVKAVAMAAGAPREKGAGVLLHAKVGYRVEEGDVLMEIYAERESKLTEAYEVATTLRPVTVEGMLLRRVPEY